MAPSPSPATSATPTTVHVGLDGRDSGSGSAQDPLRTIAAALARTGDGDRVEVGAGTFHESLVLQGHRDRSIVAAPGASVWLDGSRAVTKWASAGDTWVSDGWTTRFDSSPTFTKGAPDGTRPGWRFVSPEHPMAAHPDQVWIDGVAQRQVGAMAAVVPGTFFVDESAARLHIGSDPTGHRVRASDLSKALSIREQGATVSGINVRRYADPVPSMGAITVERPDVALSDMRIEQNATTGLGVYSTSALLQGVESTANGLMGILAGRAHDLELRSVQVAKNNTERFNPAHSAGGMKITRTGGVDIRDSSFINNNGTGLWLDESVRDFVIATSRSEDNEKHGISLEISGRGTVHDNVVRDNSGDGLKINDTDNVVVSGNTLRGNGRSIDIAQDARDGASGSSYRDRTVGLSFIAQHIDVNDNVLAAQRSPANCMVCVEDHSHRFSANQLDIDLDGNRYYRSSVSRPAWVAVWSRGPGNPEVFTSLADFRKRTGQEVHGRELISP